ncbi:MAG: DUF91 domain-containing protein [Chloroflexi bacterium]|nr:DUF91 domain-containing protein [Chloroflexota bacterium]
MTNEARLFRIDQNNGKSEAVTEVDFKSLGFQERRDIQEWIVDNPSILGEELLVVGKEFSGFDRTNERADIVAVDREGKLVIIELKRDDTGADVHWQAIKYASYFHHARIEDIVSMLAGYASIDELEAEARLKHHLDTDDLDILNNNQRIILVSHRFAPEVTSAVLWLNQKIPTENLITCVQLTPFLDDQNGSMYIQAFTIIPVPGTDDFTIRVGENEPHGDRHLGVGPVKKEDQITWFLRGIAGAVVDNLPDDLKLDKKSRWAGMGGDHRYYHVWYSRSPWSNWGMSFQIMLFEGNDSNPFKLIIGFKCLKDILVRDEGYSESDLEAIGNRLENLRIYDDQKYHNDERWLGLEVVRNVQGLETSLNDSVIDTLSNFIKSITPMIEDFENSRNEQ